MAQGGVLCRRCQLPIPTDPTRERCPRCGRLHRAWHLGHDDFDRSLPCSPEHECCNCGTNGRPTESPIVERADWRLIVPS